MKSDAPDEHQKQRLRFSIWYVVVGLSAVLWVQHTIQTSLQAEKIPYSDFKTWMATGKIASVEVTDKVITGHLKLDKPDPKGAKEGRVFATVRVDDPDLLKDLQKGGVKVSGQVQDELFSNLMSWAIPVGLFALSWMFIGRRFGQGAQGFLSLGRSKAKVYIEKDIAVRFSDVAGVDEARGELAEVVDFLKEPKRFARLGAHIPKGILLVGPPGTGKTLLARAVAGEAGVPFFSISGSEFVEMFVGLGAARVRDLFVQAKTKAPCIIFIDELDALGKVRGAGVVANDEREQTLNQLLVEMDGFDPRGGVMLMAATNRPEILDPALLRAGRFDRHVLVDRPDKVGRLAILKLHAKAVVMDNEADLDAIAGMTAGFVGADLANLVNEAALVGVRRGRDKVGRGELEEAVERVVAGLEKKSRVLTPAEKKRVAHHEMGHALVALSIPGADPVQKISIIPRGISALGYTMQAPLEDRFLMTRGELENKIAVLLGGRAAEELVFGDESTGAEDDLGKATEIARNMIKSYGMSRRLGSRSFSTERRTLLTPLVRDDARGDYGEATAQLIDAEVAELVETQHKRARRILEDQKEILLDAAARLLASETMSGDDLKALADHARSTSASASMALAAVAATRTRP